MTPAVAALRWEDVPHAAPLSYRPLTFAELERDDPDRLKGEATGDGNSARNADTKVDRVGQLFPNRIPTKRMGRCLCGCGEWVELDQWAHQQYAPKHGGKAIYLRRIKALRTAIEAWLIARGWGICSAEDFAYHWVRERFERAKRIMRLNGYDYFSQQWRFAG